MRRSSPALAVTAALFDRGDGLRRRTVHVRGPPPRGRRGLDVVPPDGRDVVFTRPRSPTTRWTQNLTELRTVAIAWRRAAPAHDQPQHAGRAPRGRPGRRVRRSPRPVPTTWLADLALPSRERRSGASSRSACTGVEQLRRKPDGSLSDRGTSRVRTPTAKKTGEEKYASGSPTPARSGPVPAHARLPSRHIWLQPIEGSKAKRLDGRSAGASSSCCRLRAPPSPGCRGRRTAARSAVRARPRPRAGASISTSVALLDVASGGRRRCSTSRRAAGRATRSSRRTARACDLLAPARRAQATWASAWNEWWIRPPRGRRRAQLLTRAPRPGTRLYGRVDARRPQTLPVAAKRPRDDRVWWLQPLDGPANARGDGRAQR